MPKLRYTLALALWSAVPLPALAHPTADLVITDARIYTADAARSMAEAIAVRADKVVFVGRNDEARRWIGPKTKVRRLGGRLVLPGLYDTHIHPAGIVDLDVCDLRSEAKSLKALADFVRGCIDRYRIPAGAWVNVRQWNFSNGNEPDPAHATRRPPRGVHPCRSCPTCWSSPCASRCRRPRTRTRLPIS
jgi:predicted amidohydrolase YtcJ